MIHSLIELEPFAVGFLNSPIDTKEYRIASGMLTFARHLPLQLKDNCIFACHAFPEIGVNYLYGDGIKVTPELLEEEIKLYPEYTEELQAIKKTFSPLDTRRMVSEALTQTQRDLAEAKVCIPMGEWGGHANPDYDMLLRLGSNGLREKNHTYRQQNPGKKDMTNQLSYDILKTARKFKYETPNLTMRTHKNTPAELWESAVETIATGIGMPALYNDESVCPSLEALGIPPVDSHNYCMNGCNQIDIFGKSHMGLEDGDISLAKCLELTLHNGYCPKLKKIIGKTTGDPVSFKSYGELWNAYQKQLEYIVDLAVNGANQAQEIYAVHAPNPYRSNLIQGCIETGRDYKARGPVYGHGQFLTEGLADAINSLAVLKHFVFETGKYTMEQVIDALEKDYRGYEQVQQEFLHFPKFGNDNAFVDEIAADVQKHYFGYLLTKN